MAQDNQTEISTTPVCSRAARKWSSYRYC